MSASRYAEAALERELEAVRGAGPGGRASETFRAALALGSLVGAGALDEDETLDLLLAAAVWTGLSEREAMGHVRRGLRIGAQTPRELPKYGDRGSGRRRSGRSRRRTARPEPAPTKEVER